MVREEILNAIKEASNLTQQYINEPGTSLDLITIADELSIPILFRPLENMWGGAVTINGKSGILIKSNLPRHLQRFTLAHEIGHIILGHKNQFDDQVGIYQRATGRDDRPIEEMAADSFASELLAPRALIERNAKRKGWSSKELQDPNLIYQLSLRLGISFEATCWALVEHNLLPRHRAEDLSEDSESVKNAKSSVAPYSVQDDSYADVWSLSEEDSGVPLEGSEDDVFFVKLEERSSAGYRWEACSGGENIDIKLDKNHTGNQYGSSSSRIVAFKFISSGDYELKLQHKRPWSDDTIEEITFLIDNRGREQVGIPRTRKQKALGEVTA